MTKEQAKGHGAILAATLIFGLNGPFSNDLLATGILSPWVHMSARFGVSALLFWIVSLFSKDKKLERQDFKMILGAALAGVVFNQGGFAFAISMTTPISQSLVATMGPIMAMILAAIFLKEPITRTKVFGVLLGFMGVLMLLFSKENQGGSVSVWGIFLALFATFNYTLYLTLFRNIILKYSPIELMKWLFLISFILVLPFSFRPIVQTPWSTLSATTLWELGFVVIFSTFVAYFLLPIGQKRLRPTVIAMYNYMSPIITTIVALAMGLEKFGYIKLIAGILVILGVYTVTRSKSRQDTLRKRATTQSPSK